MKKTNKLPGSRAAGQFINLIFINFMFFMVKKDFCFLYLW